MSKSVAIFLAWLSNDSAEGARRGAVKATLGLKELRRGFLDARLNARQAGELSEITWFSADDGMDWSFTPEGFSVRA